MSKFSVEFIDGIIVALQVLHQADQPVLANELVSAAVGIDAIRSRINQCGNDCDKEILTWLGF